MQPYNQQYEEQPPSYTIPSGPHVNPSAPYVGNQKDMLSFLAMIAGAGLLLSCVPGFNCLLPFFALIGGIIGLRGADQAINPGRARTYAWVAIIAGAIFFLVILVFAFFYGALIVAALQDSQEF